MIAAIDADRACCLPQGATHVHAQTRAPEDEATTLDLRKGETLTIERPMNKALLCTHGALWITCEAGAHADAVERGQRMFVHALTDACVSVLPALSRRGAGSTKPSWLRSA